MEDNFEQFLGRNDIVTPNLNAKAQTGEDGAPPKHFAVRQLFLEKFQWGVAGMQCLFPHCDVFSVVTWWSLWQLSVTAIAICSSHLPTCLRDAVCS